MSNSWVQLHSKNKQPKAIPSQGLRGLCIWDDDCGLGMLLDALDLLVLGRGSLLVLFDGQSVPRHNGPSRAVSKETKFSGPASFYDTGRVLTVNSAVSLSTVTWVRLTPSWKCSEISEGRLDAAKVIFVESEIFPNTDHVFCLLLCEARSVSPSVVCAVITQTDDRSIRQIALSFPIPYVIQVIASRKKLPRLHYLYNSLTQKLLCTFY